MKKLFFISIVILLGCTVNLTAASKYWVGTTDNNWNNAMNWASSSGGTGGAGGITVPGSGDVANFDGNGLVNCTLDAAVNVAGLQVAAGYTMTITQSTNTITIGTSGATLSGGTFSGGSANITATGVVTISGCAFTSTSGTFSTNSNFTYSSGSFTHNSGRMKFTASCTITGSISMYDLELAPAALSVFTIASGTTVTVNNDLHLTGGSNYLGIQTGTIDVKKNIYHSNTGGSPNGGNGTVKVSGTTKQTIYGHSGVSGPLPNFVINKSDTLLLTSGVVFGASFTRTAGVLDAGSSTVTFKDATTATITGNSTFNHLIFYYYLGNCTYTIASGNVLTVNGDLTWNGDEALSINTGTIHVKNDFSITNNNAVSGGGTGKIIFNGDSTQSLTGSTNAGAGHLCDIEVNKSASDTLKLFNYVTAKGDWVRTAGVISAGSSTVYFYNTKTITGSHALYNVVFTGGAASTFTISGGTTLTVNGALELAGAASMTLNTGSIDAKGNISLTNTGTAGGGNATINICGSVNQTVDGAGGVSDARLPNVTINKTGGTLYLQDYINVMGNWTRTAGDTDPGSSTVGFYTTKTISGTDTLYNIRFGSGTATFTISNTLNVLNSLDIAGNTFAMILNTGTINVYGDVSTTNTSTSSGGTATINLVGGNAQTLTGSGTAGAGRYPNMTIDKSGGTLTLASVISVTGNWTFTTTGSGSVDPGTSTVAFYGTFNLDGQASGSTSCMPFYNVAINGNTRTLTGNLDVNGNFTIASVATCSAGSNTIYVGGDWNSAGTWTYGTSTVVFDGNGYNKIEGTGTINFANVSLNRNTSPGTPSKNVRLLDPVLVNTAMTFNKGRVYSTTTNYLSFADNATCTVTNDDSAYVHGPVRKTGNDAFSFPLGDTTLHDSIAYHPLTISAPGSVSDRFEAVYNAIGQTLGSTIVDSLYDLSTCEKWSLERQVGTSNVLVTLSWNRNSCNTDVYGNMRVANWSGSGWADLGASAISVLYGGKGTVTSSGNPTYVSNFAYLTTAVSKNNFPTAILTKKLDGSYYKAINGRLFFRFDEEYYDTGDLTFNIYDDEHTLVSSNSMMPATAQPQVVYGDNRFHLNTVGCEITPSGPLADGFYILEVINDKNEKWYLRFEQDANIMIGNCPPPNEAE